MASGNVPAMLLMSICALAFSTIASGNDINDPPIITQFVSPVTAPCGRWGHLSCYITSSSSGQIRNDTINVTFFKTDLQGNGAVDLKSLPQAYTVTTHLNSPSSTTLWASLRFKTSLRETALFTCNATSVRGFDSAVATVTPGSYSYIYAYPPTSAAVNTTSLQAEMVCWFADFIFTTDGILLSVHRHGQQVVNGTNRLTYFTEVRRGYWHFIYIRISHPTIEDAGNYTCRIMSPCDSNATESRVTLSVVESTVCIASSCLNGGTCVEQNGSSTTCLCGIGFTGSKCQEINADDQPTTVFASQASVCGHGTIRFCSFVSSTSGRILYNEVNVSLIRLSDGVDLRNLPQDYSTTVTQRSGTSGIVRLEFRNPEVGSDLIQCKVTSAVGTAMATSNITLTRREDPSVYTQTTTSTTVNATDTEAELTCLFRDGDRHANNPVLLVYRHGRPVVNGTNRLLYFTDFRQGYYNYIYIRISNPTAEDAGIYTCHISTGCLANPVEANVTLTVDTYFIPPPTRPSVPPRPTAQIITGVPTTDHNIRVQCSSSRMKVTIPFSISNPDIFSTPCVFGEPVGGVSTDEYVRQHWGNQAAIVASSVGPLKGHCHCAASREDLNSQWVFDFGLDQCGTSAPLHYSEAGSRSQLVYLNNVFAGKRSRNETVSYRYFSANQSVTSSPEHPVYISLQAKCYFDDVIFTTTFGYVISRIPTKTSFNISGIGVFAVSSGFVANIDPSLPTQQPSNPVADVPEFAIGRPVTFQIALETSSSLAIHPVDCWTSTGAIDDFLTPSVDIVRNGCPQIDEVQISATQWSGNSTRLVRISYNAFVFRGQEAATYYLHCSVRICTPLSASRFCTANCADVVQRKRRQQSSSPSSSSSEVVQVNDGSALFTFSSPGFHVNTTVTTTPTPAPNKRSSATALLFSTQISAILLAFVPWLLNTFV